MMVNRRNQGLLVNLALQRRSQPNYSRTNMLGVMLDELRTANDHLQVALDRYVNACITVKSFCTKTPWQSCSPNPLSPILVNELPMIIAYEDKLRESRLAITYSINQSLDIVPITKLSPDLLIYIFQFLVDTERGLPRVNDKAIPKYPLRLSHVCSRWRNIVSESPSLWSCIRINSRTEEAKNHAAYTHFHTALARQSLVDICVADTFSVTPKVPGSFEYVRPFSHRIRSLELQMTMDVRSKRISKVQDHLLAECLKASTGTLKRLAIVTNFTDDPPPERSCWLIESASGETGLNSLRLNIPPELLEDILHSVSELWLEGLYFNLTSKAYHGLTLLRLEDSNGSRFVITESQLLAILESSPQLQWLDICLEIVQDIVSTKRISLPCLKVLIDATSLHLLRLIQPGSNELTLSIHTDAQETTQIICGALLKDFFSRANVTTFYSEDFLRVTTDVCYLLSAVPGIRILGLSYCKLSGALFEASSNSMASLDELVLDLLGDCELEWTTLRLMIERYRVKKLVLWGHPDDSAEQVEWKWNEQRTRKELSDMGDILLHFVPESDDSVLDRFLGPIIYT